MKQIDKMVIIKAKNILFLALLLMGIPLHSQNFHALYDAHLSKYIVNGKVDYASLSENPAPINRLANEINMTNLGNLTGDNRKAFLINAYNVLVIKTVLENYPVASVQDIPNFFNLPQYLGGVKSSLNNIEKELLDTKADPRLHMALVCGAVSCPPLLSESYKPATLDLQLDFISYQALQSSVIFQEKPDNVAISTIFKWYVDDFQNVKNWISKYLGEAAIAGKIISHQGYDWALNQSNTQTTTTNGKGVESSNSLRYYASNLYTKGQFEINMFNNYFTLLENQNRTNFLTSQLRYTHGWSKRVNFVVEARLRSITNGNNEVIGTFSALKLANKGKEVQDGGNTTFSKIGISAITPRIKYQPFTNIPTLTFQHGIAIPLPFDQSEGFFDWGSASVYNDLFFDQDISAKSSIFLQLGVYLENINGAVLGNAEGYYQFSTPLTFIYQYFPNANTTYYALVNAAPQWGYSVTNGGNQTTIIPDNYNQFGAGVKQFLTSKLQVEFLWTSFHTSRINTQSATYNLGIRYYGW